MKARQNIVATIYDKKGHVLSIGRNSYIKTHPLQARFAKQVGHPQKHFLHAEVDALRKLTSQHKPHRMLILRTLKNGELGAAKPCAVCAEAIKTLYPNLIVEHT